MGPRQESYGSIDYDEETVPLELSRRQDDALKKKRWNKFIAVPVALTVVVILSMTMTRLHRSRGWSEGDGVPVAVSPIDMGLRVVDREEDASPSEIWGNITGPLPTNSWYLVRVCRKKELSNVLLSSLLC